MNHGPLIFLAAFFAIAGSWFGFVLTPQVQIGQLRQTNAVPAGAAYPVARPGLAQEGLQVYRANGCAECHSQQVDQTGTRFEDVLSDTGTNRAAVLGALRSLGSSGTGANPERNLDTLPQTILQTTRKESAEATAKALVTNGAKAQLCVVPIGPDIARGWGKRRTVAEDYLYDYPVMLGAVRIGPDLANIGARQPDAAWHLRHLYAPRSEVAGSTMPPYRFLFEKRRPGTSDRADALKLPKKFNPSGDEIVPTEQGRALVAYLLSLRSDAPLFSAPLSVASLAGGTAATATNAPTPIGVASTNAPPGESGAR